MLSAAPIPHFALRGGRPKPGTTVALDPGEQQSMARLEAVARLMDGAIVIPGTNSRFVLDGIVSAGSYPLSNSYLIESLPIAFPGKDEPVCRSLFGSLLQSPGRIVSQHSPDSRRGSICPCWAGHQQAAVHRRHEIRRPAHPQRRMFAPVRRYRLDNSAKSHSARSGMESELLAAVCASTAADWHASAMRSDANDRPSIELPVG